MFFSLGKSVINKKIIVIGLMLLFLVVNVKVNETVDGYGVVSVGFLDSSFKCHSCDVTKHTVLQDLFLCGKTCYGYRVYPNPDMLIWFDIDNPGTLNTIGPSVSVDKIAGGTWVDGVWWCCEYSAEDNSNIWIIDHGSGAMTLVGASGEGLHGLAYDDTSGILYACGVTDLFTVDMVTGVASLVGSFGVSGSMMVGIACDGYGNMYAEDLHTDCLYSVNPTTGLATLIGSFGLNLNYGQDMAIDKEDGVCYLSAFTVHAGNEGALYICNLSTGATIKIGIFGSVPTQITGFAIPYVLSDPLEAPVITGSLSGKVGSSYEYSFVTVSPDADDLSYYVEWGDGIITNWTAFVPSGVPYLENHTWGEKGMYGIRAKVKNGYGAESDWGELQVTIPISMHVPGFPLLYFIFEYFPNVFPILRYFLIYVQIS